MTIDELAHACWIQPYELSMWRRWTNERLLKEYAEMHKSEFDRIFGHNARRARLVLARILVEERGVVNEPNLFGDMPINTKE
jgi:hypothetical protein